MSSLWTPDGEYTVPRPGDPSTSSEGRPGPAGGPPSGGAPARPPGPGPSGDGEGGEPSEEELRRLAGELAETPVEDIIANHCYGLFELAALHLSQHPVNLAAARLAIDAMGQLVDGLGERLGTHASTLADGLTQLRLAFVRIAETARAPEPAAAEGAGNPAAEGAGNPAAEG